MLRTITDNELDIVMRLAARRLVKKEIERLESMDTSQMPEAPGFDKKVRAAIRRDAQKEKLKKVWKPVGHVVKTVGIVIVVGIVALFTMAMAIRPLRTAVWDAVVEWYENYVTVSLPEEADYPQEIEEIKFPSYIPEGWSITVDSKKPKKVSYVLTGENDELIFIDQMVIGYSDELHIDNTEVELSEVMLNGQTETQLAEYSDGRIILIWKKAYVFFMETFDCPLDLVIQIAESIN